MPVSMFFRRSNSPSGITSWCKDCYAAHERAKHVADPDRAKHRRRRYVYGLSRESSCAMELAQGFLCALCGDRPTKLYVDHDHASGRVRALVCHQCNVGLGFFKEDPVRLLKAVAYLKRHNPVR